jgi:hypothetical protein
MFADNELLNDKTMLLESMELNDSTAIRERTGALMQKLEAHYAAPNTAKRYMNRLQLVAFIKKKMTPKRKTTCDSYAVSVTTDVVGKRAKVVQLDADGKEELMSVSSLAASSRQFLL